MNGNEIEGDSDDDSEAITTTEVNDIENQDDDDNNTLVDITFDRRKKRALYSEGGTMNAVYQTANTELPLDEAIKRQEAIDANTLDEAPLRMNRWDFYKIFEHMAER